MTNRPNILWFCTDQQRFDTIHALGNEYIHTPNIDRLVSEGVAFNYSYNDTNIVIVFMSTPILRILLLLMPSSWGCFGNAV